MTKPPLPEDVGRIAASGLRGVATKEEYTRKRAYHQATYDKIRDACSRPTIRATLRPPQPSFRKKVKSACPKYVVVADNGGALDEVKQVCGDSARFVPTRRNELEVLVMGGGGSSEGQKCEKSN